MYMYGSILQQRSPRLHLKISGLNAWLITVATVLLTVFYNTIKAKRNMHR